MALCLLLRILVRCRRPELVLVRVLAFLLYLWPWVDGDIKRVFIDKDFTVSLLCLGGDKLSNRLFWILYLLFDHSFI